MTILILWLSSLFYKYKFDFVSGICYDLIRRMQERKR